MAGLQINSLNPEIRCHMVSYPAAEGEQFPSRFTFHVSRLPHLQQSLHAGGRVVREFDLHQVDVKPHVDGDVRPADLGPVPFIKARNQLAVEVKDGHHHHPNRTVGDIAEGGVAASRHRVGIVVRHFANRVEPLPADRLLRVGIDHFHGKNALRIRRGDGLNGHIIFHDRRRRAYPDHDLSVR